MLKADVRQRVRAAKMQAKRDTVVGRKPCKSIIGILGIGMWVSLLGIVKVSNG